MVACDIDLRVGGSWRYVIRKPDGTELAWSGVYREIDRPRRLVATETFEPYPDAEAVNTMTLEEHDGATTMRVTAVYGTREARDGHLNAPMEPGMQLALNRVDDLLAERLAGPRGGRGGSRVDAGSGPCRHHQPAGVVGCLFRRKYRGGASCRRLSPGSSGQGKECGYPYVRTPVTRTNGIPSGAIIGSS